jgi:hypothetical protein
MLHVRSCQQYIVYSSLSLLKALEIARWVNKFQITQQDKIMESVHVWYVTNDRSFQS